MERKRPLWAALAAALSAGVCAINCALSVAPSSAAEATTGAIEGTVSRADGAAVADARVASASPAGEYRGATDDRGRFTILGVTPGTYTVSVEKTGYAPAVRPNVDVAPGQQLRLVFRLSPNVQTIGSVVATSGALIPGAASESFSVSGAAAQARAPTVNASGLATYTAGTVQGAIAAVPGVDLDSFANAILRGGKVKDTAFAYDSVPVPQGLIAEPGGNIVGAQLPTTGIASTTVTLAGITNQGENALGGLVDEFPAIGTYPGHASLELSDGIGALHQLAALQGQWATPDLRWRYAIATTVSNDYIAYGDGHTFYPSEVGTYGLALQSRGLWSSSANVHFTPQQGEDLSLDVLTGKTSYQQYDSPYTGETYGAFDGQHTIFPGEVDPDAPVTFASGVQGTYDIVKLQQLRAGAHATTRVQLYQTQFSSRAGGPFWDDLSFPDGVISLAAQQGAREDGLSFDIDALGSERHELKYGLEYRVNNSFLNQVVPTAGEQIHSNPTLFSYLLYLSDEWHPSPQLSLVATARFTDTHSVPSDGSVYDVGALDPHLAAAYQFANGLAARATFDHTTVAPEPLEVDRTDTANPAPFVPLAPETANGLTISLEGGGRTRFRVTYYAELEQNLIDVLPFNFRSAVASGENPSGVGVPANAGELRAHGFDLWLKNGGLTFDANLIRGFSSSASQFAFNGLNAAAVAAGQLFPLGYVPDLTASLSYELDLARKRIRITPSLSYESGYPYGNGTQVWIFDPTTNKPVQVPNDNYVNPGYNYYFLANPALPYNAATNPYSGSLGTPEGPAPNTLRSVPQTLVSLHIEGDLSRHLTLALDVANLFGVATPAAMQGNPYLIGPPGYAGGNPLYAAAYQTKAGFAQPYVLGNGVPTNDGVSSAVPWSYGTAGYVPQAYPTARSVWLTLRYRL